LCDRVTPMHFVWHFCKKRANSTQFVWVMLFVWGSGPIYFVWGFLLRKKRVMTAIYPVS
jgi:hypothetical protein